MRCDFCWRPATGSLIGRRSLWRKMRKLPARRVRICNTPRCTHMAIKEATR